MKFDCFAKTCLALLLWSLGIALGCSLCCQPARGSSETEFAFLLLLQEEQAESVVAKPVQKQSIDWQDYRQQAKLGWPDGAVVYVSIPNCRPCLLIQKRVFPNPQVIAELNRKHVMVRTEDDKSFDALRGRENFAAPFLMFIAPGGDVIKRVNCPQMHEGKSMVSSETTAFLKLIEQHTKVNQ